VSSWTVKHFTTRSINGYKIPSYEDLKDGDEYFIKDVYRKSMTHRMNFEINYQTSLGLKSYYERNIKSQIKSGLIYIKVK
jgi:hypothetical protein